jgi:nitrate/nitrite-specific signal transduction histidine kinase
MHASQGYRSRGDESPELLRDVVFNSGQEVRAVAIVPLKLENTTIGALWSARLAEETFTETDLIWLDSMADQVVIAIQHGLMTSQLQTLSIVEERSRIAREMHDGLAQVLGYLNLQVQTLGSLLKQGKPDQLQAELHQMREAIRLANADVRENILSLRTTLARERGLVSAVDEYLAEFGIQSGIETQFINQVEGELNLSSVAEVQLVCILQEALSNVRKHAGAGRVEVVIAGQAVGNAGQILMKISDDGQGFTISGSKRSFGLQTMRERAESVGGKLSIHSGPGNGTRIECRLPCLQPERLHKQSVVIR